MLATISPVVAIGRYRNSVSDLSGISMRTSRRGVGRSPERGVGNSDFRLPLACCRFSTINIRVAWMQPPAIPGGKEEIVLSGRRFPPLPIRTAEFSNLSPCSGYISLRRDSVAVRTICLSGFQADKSCELSVAESDVESPTDGKSLPQASANSTCSTPHSVWW